MLKLEHIFLIIPFARAQEKAGLNTHTHSREIFCWVEISLNIRK